MRFQSSAFPIISIFCCAAIVAVFSLSACSTGDAHEPTTPTDNPMERLWDSEAGEIVERAIEFSAGSWENWADKRTVSYDRQTNRFDENGEVTETIVQTHQYVLHPPLKVHISWEENGDMVELVNNGEQAIKRVNGERAESEQDRNHAWNATFGSHYVFSMPFKLTDPGARLSYAGQDTLANGTVADVVSVEYEEGAGTAAGEHSWTYYFDSSDGRLVANHLQYGSGPDDYSFTEYLDYKQVDGVYIPTRRYGYRSNADAEPLERRTETINKNVRFNETLSDNLFDID